MLFSREFNITRNAADDWFDPILESDTELFLDPYLLFKEKSGLWKGAHDELIAHFDDLFLLIAKSGGRKKSPHYIKALTLLLFPEPEPFCLGYTSKGTGGAGGSSGIAKLIAKAMEEVIELGIARLDHFEMLGIFNEKIGPDRIGDLVCTILKLRFIEYTEDVAKRHGLKTEQHTIKNAGAVNGQWLTWTGQLPTNPETGLPVLLVPERFLRRLPTLNSDDWWEWYGIKANLNIDIVKGADKKKIIREAVKHRADVDTWAKTRRKPSPYDLVIDPELVWRWEQISWDWVGKNPVNLQTILSDASLKQHEKWDKIVELVVGKFKQFIEKEGGNDLLWNDDDTEKHESASQNLFRGIAKHYCQANGIAIDREVNLGRGPVDFKFSVGASYSVHLEVKTLHNGAFWHGLDTQLIEYMKSDEGTERGWLLAIQLRSGGVSKERRKELPGQVAKVAKEHDLALRYGVVDGRQWPSASNKQKPKT